MKNKKKRKEGNNNDIFKKEHFLTEGGKRKTHKLKIPCEKKRKNKNVRLTRRRLEEVVKGREMRIPGEAGERAVRWSGGGGLMSCLPKVSSPQPASSRE